ncbi:Sugar fermentation stimulation protein A [Methyloligella halotolerans]|uniref:Sugar fermentation stimulation protein homolog n=1 Tax=Methyloligella halotolerans TaxID=1177755 RepID=A0A1E2S3E0_9HYPH|nr:DNA/RNA nuclease SfsA [Methyloligella halotolerans]ODA68848.1 Sugar fermentation stimulation protein A [Methyloligella halotolerans]
MLHAYPSDLIPGTLIRRYKRFLADIKLQTGETVTAHCCNPGAMLGLSAEGSRVWVSKSNNPKRKLRFSWELIEVDLGEGPALVGINTALPNTLVAAALAQGAIPELARYGEVRREVRYGTNSRIDFLLQDEGGATCHVEVKNVHLMREPGLAEFPDSVTARGAKHLSELAKVAQHGGRAAMLYLIQRSDARSFALAADIDPAYADGLAAARSAGVEVLAYACQPSLRGFETVFPIATGLEERNAASAPVPVARAALSS